MEPEMEAKLQAVIELCEEGANDEPPI